MLQALKPGTRLLSTACTTEIIVVKAPPEPIDLRCGGSPMVVASEHTITQPCHPDFSDGTHMGKRYCDSAQSLEALCTKAGSGSLSAGNIPLVIRDAKSLPSSD